MGGLRAPKVRTEERAGTSGRRWDEGNRSLLGFGWRFYGVEGLMFSRCTHTPRCQGPRQTLPAHVFAHLENAGGGSLNRSAHSAGSRSSKQWRGRKYEEKTRSGFSSFFFAKTLIFKSKSFYISFWWVSPFLDPASF